VGRDTPNNRATQSNGTYGPAYYNRGLLYLDNDPFPGITDALVRLQTAKDLFDKYKATPGFDQKLVADRPRRRQGAQEGSEEGQGEMRPSPLRTRKSYC